MLLTIDVGNTQTAVGLFDGRQLAFHWRLSTVRERTTDEYQLLLHGLFEQDGVDPERFAGAVISSVVPEVTSALSGALRGFVTDGTLVLIVGLFVLWDILSLLKNEDLLYRQFAFTH